jgi:uncharacterized protein
VRDAEVASTHLFVGPSEIRGKGTTDRTDLVALLQYDRAGAFVRYDREVKTRADGGLVSSVSVTYDGAKYALRERAGMGARTKSVNGPPVDLCVDAAFPEAMIPFLGDLKRTSFRVLILPDLVVKTVVFEQRPKGARYAGLPDGGVTSFYDASGAFDRLALPGPEGRVVVTSGAASRPARPPQDQPITIDVPGGKLGASVWTPSAGEPGPAVVLLGDGGPRDRDGQGGGSQVQTLRLLAEALGVVSIRADKRGVGESTEADADLAMLVADARALVEKLFRHPAVDPSRIFIAGHGEGAIVAAEAARGSSIPIAGVIMLASPARPLAEALEARLRVRLAAAGQLAEAIDGAAATLRAEISSLQNLAPDATLTPGQGLLRDLVGIEPASQIAALRQRVLVLHASDDREIPAAQVGLMRASLACSSDRVRFEMVDGATHDLVATVAPGGLAPPAPPESADVARELHSGFPTLIRGFIMQPARPLSGPAK